jgi:glucose-1-phosphate thymidylyltransferase
MVAIEKLTAAARPSSPPAAEAKLIEYPHDVIRYNAECIRENLEFRMNNGNYRQTCDGVFLADDASVHDSVVCDTKAGAVVVDSGATVGPFCFLKGPLHVGSRSRVNEFSSIKDAVSLGHTTKTGGEVEATVIEAYSNKQHFGFLGHSYLGSWINLGAGTCNSDLKNTYGQVNMTYGTEKVATGLQFLGFVMGDYTKSAIGTGIFTGKTIGVCSMLYGFVTTNVPSFVNYARAFDQVTELPLSVMESTQQRMFHRRNVAQRPIDIQLLADMYELTRQERQLSEEPLML